MVNENPDIEIIKALQRGDPFAFDQIYDKYNEKIYSVSLSFFKNSVDAEEVIQDVFLNLWRKRADLHRIENFNSYLFTITYNTIRNHFRKLSRERKHIEDYLKNLALDDDSTNAEIEYANLLELADKAISKLPPRQKSVYCLNMQEGLNIEEISVKLGISNRTVENHLHRAKLYLKKALSDKRLISILFICLFIQ